MSTSESETISKTNRGHSARALVRGLPDVVFRLDLCPRHLYISPVVETITGIPVDSWLGLYVSRGLVEAHGGRIWVESGVGKSSAFHITLPLA